MKHKLINVLMFATGAALGSLATWKYVKTKYERIAQEEIDSVKEVFRERTGVVSKPDCDVENHEPDKVENDDEAPWDRNSTEMNDYTNIAGRYSSTAEVSTIKNEQKGGGVHMIEKPYVIDPDEFGEKDGYETTTLTYYADGVLEDDYYIVIENEDVDAMIGLESLEHFGDYEPDTVFVRNEKLKTDFEIQRDLRKYSETTHESLRNGL